MEKSKHKAKTKGNGAADPELGKDFEQESDDAFKVADKRHWAEENEEKETEEEPTPRAPSIIDEYRARTEEAERKLHEYIEAYKTAKKEQDQVRKRLQEDVQNRAQRMFGSLVGDLLGTIDHLDLALQHAGKSDEAQALAQGVKLARDGFIQTLLQHGVERIAPEGQPFDPNEAEAVRMDPVDESKHDQVTEVLRPGYRFGELVLRPAQVAVGRGQV